MEQYICDGATYALSGPNNDSICLPVELAGLPDSIHLSPQNLTLGIKSEFHVTLVPVGELVRKYTIAESVFFSKVLKEFCEFVRSNPIEVLQYKDEFRFVAEGDRRTVVRMCAMSNLDKFFDILNRKYNLTMQPPPTHVTLYTLQPDVGIFLVDAADLENLSSLIPAPIQ